ncbi:glycoside hydrolase family 30 beta sandwich domain-containing protein [Clostridium sp. Marseille-P2415]
MAGTCYTSGLNVTAWENPDGSVILVVLNRWADESVYMVQSNQFRHCGR